MPLSPRPRTGDTTVMTSVAAAKSIVPTHKRRWFQFSLRTLLAGMTAVAFYLAVLSMWIAPAQRQRAAVGKIHRFGGSVQYAFPPRDESSAVRNLRTWLAQDYFDSVIDVHMSYPSQKLMDADLVHVEAFPKLERV